MRRTTIGVTAAALAAAATIGISGAAIANAADDTAATPTPSATAPPGAGAQGAAGGPSQDTAVTGAAADKVVAAVKAEDSSVSITEVRKDPDGSFDALGTKDGSPVFFDVSADLKTVTQNTGGPGGMRGPGGASQDTAVTGAAADKVVAAVKAEDSSVSISEVRKDPDGSFDALGTKDGSPVFFDVSADLKTVTQNTGGPGGPGGMRGPGGPGGTGSGTTGSSPTDANGGTTTNTSSAV